jgi:hypothetical protein
MVNGTRVIWTVVILPALSVCEAHAQTDSRLAVGVGLRDQGCQFV